MKEFLRSGVFGGLRLQDPAEAVRDILGEPPNKGGMTRRQTTPTIWKYGDVEFHFADDGQCLWMIFCDDFQKLNLGPAAVLDAWFFAGRPTVKEVEQHLIAERIPFQRLDMPHEPSGEMLRLESGVELLIIKDGVVSAYSEPPGLFGFQLCLTTAK